MFSVEQALRFPLHDLKDWTVHVRCDRCSRRTAVPLRGLVRRDDRRLLANVMAAMRFRRCLGKPGAVLLTNTRDQTKIRSWLTHETGKGHVQLVLWDDATQR